MYTDLSPGRTGITMPSKALIELAPRHGFQGIDVPPLGIRSRQAAVQRL